MAKKPKPAPVANSTHQLDQLVRALADDCHLHTLHPLAREGVLRAFKRTLSVLVESDYANEDAQILLDAWDRIVY